MTNRGSGFKTIVARNRKASRWDWLRIFVGAQTILWNHLIKKKTMERSQNGLLRVVSLVGISFAIWSNYFQLHTDTHTLRNWAIKSKNMYQFLQNEMEAAVTWWEFFWPEKIEKFFAKSFGQLKSNWKKFESNKNSQQKFDFLWIYYLILFLFFAELFFSGFAFYISR